MRLLRLTFVLLLNLAMSAIAYSSVMLTEINGNKINFTSLQGKWVMINYWASWCQPCLDEIHELNAFYRHNHKKVALYAVNYDGLSVQQQQRLIEQYHINYPSLRHDPSKLLELGALVGVPATYVFNPQGQWVDTLYGGQTKTSLNKAIHPHRS
jgi:thiol-disulfide isomerase/thioredoxin